MEFMRIRQAIVKLCLGTYNVTRLVRGVNDFPSSSPNWFDFTLLFICTNMPFRVADQFPSRFPFARSKKKKNNFVSSTLLLSTHHRALWSPIPFLYRLQCRCHQFSLIKLAIITVRSHMSGSLRISSTTPVSRIRLCFAEYYYQVLSAKPEKHSSFFFSKKSTLCSDAYSFSS